MKRLGAIFVTTILTLLLPTPTTNADSSITIAEPTHRDATGVFVDDELAKLVSPEGRLGKSLFGRKSSVSTFLIDIATLEEIQDLTDGYSYRDDEGKIVAVSEFANATIFLNFLKSSIKGKRINVLPYGNPDRTFLEREAPGEYVFLKQIAKERGLTIFGTVVESVGSANMGTESYGASRALSNKYRKELRSLYSAAPTTEVLSLRLKLGQLLNPGIKKESIAELSESAEKALSLNSKRLRVASGGYTITASNYDLPVTVINDFSLPVTVKVNARPTNSRIVVGKIPVLTVPANSQSQVEIPLTVIASGETQLEIKLQTLNGRSVGVAESVPLRLAVISPLTTWFTTGMAIILLLAAVVQSLRRVRKRKQQ